MPRSLESTVELRNGVRMPQLGLGTFRMEAGAEVEQAVAWGLELGYRSIDTASVYGNEQGVGKAIRQSGLSREQIFLTTKVWNDDQGFDSTLRAFDASLERLGMEYVDLYLIHWPVNGQYKQTWRALERLAEEGRARSIGVSNFLIHHLRDLLADAESPPVVNQFEYHPRLQQPDLRQFCVENRIAVEAWSPLMKGQVFDLPELQAIGQKHGKSAGQVVLRWQLQQGAVTIPKSSKREHLEANADIFDFKLGDDEMKAIDALDENNRIGPNPDGF